VELTVLLNLSILLFIPHSLLSLLSRRILWCVITININTIKDTGKVKIPINIAKREEMFNTVFSSFSTTNFILFSFCMTSLMPFIKEESPIFMPSALILFCSSRYVKASTILPLFLSNASLASL
jgi:hypothetical protein